MMNLEPNGSAMAGGADHFLGAFGFAFPIFPWLRPKESKKKGRSRRSGQVQGGNAQDGLAA
jgi:hypothetical protein